MTKQIGLTPEQHAARYKGIGGSDAAVALGISPWKTRYQLWVEKSTPPSPDYAPMPPTERMLWGTLLEDAIATQVAADMKVKAVKTRQTFVHPTMPWMLGNIDRAVVNPAIAKRVRWSRGRLTTDRIIEVKNVGWLSPEWGEEFTDEVPVHYLVQCIHYIIVTGVEFCTLGALVGGNKLARYEIKRDPRMVEMVIEGEREFWKMVQDGTPPPVQTLADVRLKYPAAVAEQGIEAEVEITNAVADMRTLNEKMAELTAQYTAAELRVKDYMGENAVLTQYGVPLATWKSQKGRSRVDRKLLEAKYPDVAREVTVEGEPSRVFLLK